MVELSGWVDFVFCLASKEPYWPDVIVCLGWQPDSGHSAERGHWCCHMEYFCLVAVPSV